MNKFFLGTACAIFIPCGTTVLQVYFNDIAQAGSEPKTVVCEIPPARPTGGNTLQRMVATQICEQQLKNQQTLTNTPVINLNQSSTVQNQAPNEKLGGVEPQVCQVPVGSSTQAKQQCNPNR